MTDDMRVFTTIDGMCDAVEAANSAPTEEERIERLCQFCYRPNIDLSGMDPFSTAYRAKILDVYRQVANRSSYSIENELAPYLDSADAVVSNYYTMGSTRFLGEVMRAMGEILWQLNLKPQQALLEYGAGEGSISLEAAKAGVAVTVMDIEPRYLRLIERRAAAAGVTITTVEGEFGQGSGEFDAVLFYEAFHHALDHFEVAKKIATMLKPNGRLVLAGEPVVGPHNEQWRPMLPYLWGVRLDGLSFRAIQTYGWMELGFDEGYLYEMLMRAGFVTSFERSAITDRGSCYVARPYGNRLDLGASFTIRAAGRPQEWHAGEGGHRWTGTEEAVLPFRPLSPTLSVELINYRPEAVDFEIETTRTEGGRLDSGERRTIGLPSAERIMFRSSIRLGEAADPRPLGLAVSAVIG